MFTRVQARFDVFARLRQQWDTREGGAGSKPAAPMLATDLPGIDDPLGGGLPRGALTELVFAVPSSGGQLVLLHLLHAARRSHRFLALVDGADGFDPPTVEPASLLRHLLWVRCSGAAHAMQAADLLARDSNFVLLAVDLRGCEARELRRTPATAWYRLQRVVELTDTVLVVLTPRQLVPAAQVRLAFRRSLPLTALAMEQASIAEQLAPEVDRLRSGARWEEEDMSASAGLQKPASAPASEMSEQFPMSGMKPDPQVWHESAACRLAPFRVYSSPAGPTNPCLLQGVACR